MENRIVTRRGFVAMSVAALGGLALAGCAPAAEQAASASSQAASSVAAASSSVAPAAASSVAPAASSVQAASSASTEAASSQAAEATSSAQAAPAAGSRVLVACFSATGNTRAIAEMAAAHLGADYVEIQPAEPYTDADLNYDDESTRATSEQNNPETRPALAAVPDFSGYDTILLGHPIWWGKAPRLICTLLESTDLSGKNVAEFCTSGSSGIDGATDELQGLAPGANWIDARRFAAGTSEAEVAEWVDSLGIA